MYDSNCSEPEFVIYGSNLGVNCVQVYVVPLFVLLLVILISILCSPSVEM